MEPAMVTVRGRSSVPAEPDEVRLLFWVSFRADSTEAVMQEVTNRSATLEAIFAEVGISRSGWSTSGMSVREEPEHDDRGRVVRTGFRADARFMVRLADGSLTGRLLIEATGRAEARVEGPWWSVATENPARTEACHQAVGDARRKAEAYADALGAHLGEVMSVTEPEHGVGGHVLAGGGYSFMAGGGEFDVNPGRLEVSAAVDVTYLLE